LLGLLKTTMSTLMPPQNSSVHTSGAPNRLYALIGACILAGALPGCAVFPKSSNPVADEAITADVKSRLAQDAEFITPGLIDVQTVNGVAHPPALPRRHAAKSRSPAPPPLHLAPPDAAPVCAPFGQSSWFWTQRGSMALTSANSPIASGSSVWRKSI
jgi:hypothetical protein